jgi:hypothetical protein
VQWPTGSQVGQMAHSALSNYFVLSSASHQPSSGLHSDQSSLSVSSLFWPHSFVVTINSFGNGGSLADYSVQETH